MERKGNPISEWTQRYLKGEAPRSKSLMISALGDSIAPFAEGIWLGDFIKLLAPLGLSERLVRTSAFRLIEESWLSARREGRRSHYALTATGVRRFETAYGRIYTPPQAHWDGLWTVLLLLPRGGETRAERQELRRRFEWAGFASPTAGVLLHPTVNDDALRQTLQDLEVLERTVVMRAQSVEDFATEPAGRMVAHSWNLGDVAKRYARFIDRFGPLMTKIQLATATPEQAFVVQTLLIHSYRRATLHDPRLPAALLPTSWRGMEAFTLARQIYRVTLDLTQQHLQSVLGAGRDGRRPRLGRHVRERFGGLT